MRFVIKKTELWNNECFAFVNRPIFGANSENGSMNRLDYSWLLGQFTEGKAWGVQVKNVFYLELKVLLPLCNITILSRWSSATDATLLTERRVLLGKNQSGLKRGSGSSFESTFGCGVLDGWTTLSVCVFVGEFEECDVTVIVVCSGVLCWNVDDTCSFVAAFVVGGKIVNLSSDAMFDSK